MIESQESISVWAEETFGPVSSNARVAARANEEMSELLQALTSDEKHPKAKEEAADVLIVLYRLAARMGFDLKDEVRRWMQNEDNLAWRNLNSSNSSTDSNAYVAAQANESMSDLLSLLLRSHDPSAKAKVALIFILLSELAERMGFDLHEQVDLKMKKNRARTWNRDGTGHGYHRSSEGAAEGVDNPLPDFATIARALRAWSMTARTRASEAVMMTSLAEVFERWKKETAEPKR